LRIVFAVFALLSAFCSLGQAAIIRVPADQPTIQAAIDASSSGDEIVIAAGTYDVASPHALPQGDLAFRGVGQVVLTGSTSAFFQAVRPLIENRFRFENLTFAGNPIGIYTPVPAADLLRTHLELQNCWFSENDKGIWARNYGDLNVTDCRFEGGGTAIYLLSATLHAQDCTFIGLQLAIHSDDAPPSGLMERCLFADCTGPNGTLWLPWSSDFTLRQCTLDGCGAPGGAAIVSTFLSWINLDRCIVTNGAGAAFACGFENIYLTCSDIWNNAEGDWNDCAIGGPNDLDNFSADPLFCNPGAGDYTIDANSPCAASGNDCGVIVGAFDVGCGVTGIPELPPVEATSLSAIKSLY